MFGKDYLFTDEDKVLLDEAFQRFQKGERIFIDNGSNQHVQFFISLLLQGLERLDESIAIVVPTIGYKTEHDAVLHVNKKVWYVTIAT